jgi:hypothetical protein
MTNNSFTFVFHTQKCIRLQIFCTAKEPVNGLKRQPEGWKKIYKKHISGKPHILISNSTAEKQIPG